MTDTLAPYNEEIKQRRFVLGDIHNNFLALKEVLEESNFDYDKDLLIIIGDVTDGYCEAYECVEELLKIKNKVFIYGNHDLWILDHMKTGWAEWIWLSQGGNNTIKSYKAHGYEYPNFPQSHKDFFNSGVYWHEVDEMLFVHAGFEYPGHPRDSTHQYLVWDRELLARCRNRLKIKEWKKVFLGHTTTENEGAKPLTFQGKDSAKVIQIDCGAGWAGRLCLYNIDNDEYFLSEFAEPKNRHKFKNKKI